MTPELNRYIAEADLHALAEQIAVAALHLRDNQGLHSPEQIDLSNIREVALSVLGSVVKRQIMILP